MIKNSENKKIFEGKVLLVLGSNVSSDDIVNYAKENGAHTIVADYLPRARSFAKKLADENVLISTGDQEKLGRLIEEKHVDGVLAGIHEFNLLNAMSLAERYHLPFYCTRQQWNRMENKEEFRKLCYKCSVPAPKTYFSGTSIPKDIVLDKFPVVLKPVDAANSAGVHICMNREELFRWEKDAIQNSESRRIIVEQFVYGDEFTAHYTVCNGVPKLSCIDNRYPVAVHEGNVTTIPAARIYPSLFYDEYIEQVNPSMLNLCRELGVNNAVLFVQGMYDRNEGFHIFEGGLRSAGEAPYRILDQVNGVNYIHLLVENALLGTSVTFSEEKEDPTLRNKCCGVVSFVSKGGVVGEISGLEEAVRNTSSVITYESRYPVGVETPNGDTLRQLMIRFIMICENREQMAEDIRYLNEHVVVNDNQGKPMTVRMKPERVFDVK